ncbi:MAG: DNA-processing protein DprA [Clostridia bacterium]|nr:DNA-processing protein DprA [Clostridia bacterium]
MEETLYWLWIQNAFGFGANLSRPLACFENAKAFYEAQQSDYLDCDALRTSCAFARTKLSKLLDKDLTLMQQTLALCRDYGITVLTPADARYPGRLLSLENYPAVLFVSGNTDCLSAAHTVAVVGSRRPTQYSFLAARRIAADLSLRDCVVVSGGALGIDSAAHVGALTAERPTVLVMGGGHLAGGPKETENIREMMALYGALVSEFPPRTGANSGSFPMRNRLISGLSDAVLVIEAANASGTLNTAAHAKKQGRRLFVFPGDCEMPAYAGSRALIRAGATVVFSAEDVLFHMGLPYAGAAHSIGTTMEESVHLPQIELAKKPRQAAVGKKKTAYTRAAAHPDVPAVPAKPLPPQNVSDPAEKVFRLLEENALTFDELLVAVKLPAPGLTTALTELLLEGSVEKNANGRYALRGK